MLDSEPNELDQAVKDRATEWFTKDKDGYDWGGEEKFHGGLHIRNVVTRVP